MSNIILITYMSSLCNKKYIATHYAILISFSGLIRSFLAPTSGVVVETYGWHNLGEFAPSRIFRKHGGIKAKKGLEKT